MATRQRESSKLKEELILAGIEVLEQEGAANFSLRKTTAKCGVSAAALYRHFASKEDLLAGIVDYINGKWSKLEDEVLLAHSGASTREKLIAVSIKYIEFLMENPHFRSVVMMRDDKLPSESLRQKSCMRDVTRELIDAYSEENGLSDERRTIKTYVVRSLIYGAALMFDNGELVFCPPNMELVRKMIEREFNLD
ncbi:MAG: TetR/AcrR family transcriptional regulator [Eubacteriales bacterium]|nr:TetR/AcrR family transcriptional regulator [Eubacteriales bacterium]MDD3882262.1 TetR/AcrR family transcriptional regulator [Eubacteriales bacterium]MDD4512008.1 TetR/AcrR family transcriptional regulator [Eubacteriales bacterium]